MIDTHFQDKEVGEIYSWNGNLEDTPYDVFCLKEPDYVMKIMATYGELTFPEGQRQSPRVVHKDDGSTEINKFHYVVPFAYQFDYRHIVDDHNGLRHMYHFLEHIWVNHRCPTRVFTLLLALSEVNTYLAFIYFVWTK